MRRCFKSFNGKKCHAILDEANWRIFGKNTARLFYKRHSCIPMRSEQIS
ncbi:uncharacterized protein METZ01_LOCUS156269, partial [marine metagenome]